MGRISKEEIARLSGMAYALKIAQEGGIEALEKDIKMRGMTKLPVGVDRRALDEFSTNVKNQVIDTFIILSVATLHDEFGFGEKRCQRFIDRFNLKAECLSEDYCTWQDYIDVIKEELNIELDIRENKKDVRV